MNAPRAKKPVIGLVGGIGAGKSTAAAELGRLGCVVIDADAIGHALLEEEDVRSALRRRWGEGIFGPDGGVRREALAKRVFDDPAQLRELNRLMHPRIRAEIQTRIDRARGGSNIPAVVIDAAVLCEAGWDELCTHLIFVQAPDRTRANRVQQQRGWDPATWRRREKSQFPLDRKAAKCSYTVDNSSGESHLREQVRDVFPQIAEVVDRS